MTCKPSSPSPRGAKRRCAIYTRKSSEDGLEQSFNSLDAQREACAAYITSQRHEGWTILPSHYDDGGLSGGTLDRPALQHLLADIQAGKIDLVMVYKVDRLTRSLADFAKIVDVLDAKGVSFVSVTQQFNTTTSMGRLTLNMLLSFAQFEREVTGERIRDKIAASKRRGLWMGGTVPLGFDVKDRQLVINEDEAETIRHIYRLYLDLRSVRLLCARLQQSGIHSKRRPNATADRMRGGRMIARGALYRMLQNPIYRGLIAHKGAIYPGQHAAIIDSALWDQVQQALAENREDRAPGRRGSVNLLTGMVFDAAGVPLTPTHAVKAERRYRYYTSRTLITGPAEETETAFRIPAHNLERMVIGRLKEFLTDATAIHPVIQPFLPQADHQQHALTRAQQMAQQVWSRDRLHQLDLHITVHQNQIDLRLNPLHLVQHLLPTQPAIQTDHQAEPVILTNPACLRRAGLEVRMVIGDGIATRQPDPNLIRILARAIDWRDKLITTHTSIGDLAAAENVTGSYVTRLIRLAFLAPDIVTDIVAGNHPIRLTANKLTLMPDLPIDWTKQRQLLGFR